MSSLPLHPKLVHLPIALAVIIPIISATLLLAWWRGWFARRTWLVVIALQVLLVGSGFVAMQTGESDEHRVEAVIGERPIETHEEAAEVFVWSSVGLLALMVAALLVPHESLKQATATVAVVGTFLILYLGYRVGDAGGRLVYQHGAAQAFATASPQKLARPPSRDAVRKHHDDDDD